MRKYPCSIDSREITRQELLMLQPEKAAPLAARWAERMLLSGSVSGRDKSVLRRFHAAWVVCNGLSRGESFASLLLKKRFDTSDLSPAFFHCGLFSLMPFCRNIQHAQDLAAPVAEKLANADEESTQYYLANPFTEELDKSFRQAMERTHAMEKVTAYYLRHKMSFGHIEEI